MCGKEIFIVLLLFFSWDVDGALMQGFQFGDDNIPWARTPDIGVAEVNVSISKQFSFCAWVYMDWIRSYGSMINLLEIRSPSTLDARMPPLMVNVYKDGTDFQAQHKFTIEEENGKDPSSDSKPATTLLRKWIPICLSIDYEEQLGQVAFNGILSKKEKPDSLYGSMYQDKYGGDLMIEDTKNPNNNFTIIVGRYFLDKLSIVGKVVGINSWNRILTEEEMVKFTNCSDIKFAVGNVINQKTNWFPTAPLVMDYEVDIEEMVCTKAQLDVPAFIPVSGLNKEDAVDLCHKFGADISLAGEFNTAEDYAEFYKLLWSEQSKMFRDADAFLNRGRVLIWLPYTIQNISGTNKAIHDTTGGELGVDFWYSKEHKNRIGLEKSKCMSAYMGTVPYQQNLVWALCSGRDRGTGCLLHNSFKDTTTVFIRGLCRHSSFDTVYMVEYTKDGSIRYIGLKNSMIEFDQELKHWILTDMTNKNTNAVSTSSFRTLVLGNHQWRMQNDERCQEGTHTAILSLTACKSEEYTCNDGLCLPLELRCNGRPECKDNSDELGCTIIVRDDSYNKFLSPPPVESLLHSDKVVVNVSIKIFSVSAFDPIKSTFESQFSVSLTWLDRRLSFGNLRNSSENNAMSPTEKDAIWFPSFVFENTKDKKKSMVDEESVLLVTKKGKAKKSDLTSTENKLLYSGLENPVSYERFYNMVFQCDYYLQWYPFDTQRCLVQLVPKADLLNFVILNPGEFSYEGPSLLMTYEVKSIKMKRGKKMFGGKHVLEVEILINRRLLSIILTAFVPTILLNIIGHTSNFFKKFFFEAIISLNVTVMLVLTTMFISISNNLPKTAYLKMIDIWLLFNLLKPFVDIIVQTYIETLRKEENEREINHHGKTIKVAETVGGVVKVSPANISLEENQLRSVNEQVQRKALKEYYSGLRSNEDKIRKYQRFARVIYPAFCVSFVVLFWMIGLTRDFN